MAFDMEQERAQAHALLDLLPPAKLGAVRNLLAVMVEPTSLDDEPETEQERQAVAEGLASLERNGGVPMETVLADFGLTMEDFERMGRTPAAESLTRPGN